MRNKLLFTLVLSLSLLFINSNHASAQEVDRELGLRMSGLDNFNFIYKKSKGENKFLRIRAGAFNARFNSENEALNVGLTLAIGVEKRKPIDDKLSFIHGLEPSLQVSGNFNDQNNFSVNPSLGYVLGFNLNISDSFGINLEAIPSIRASLNIDNDGDVSDSYSFGFNSNSVALGLVYRFKK